jgi:hypothetical protein
MHAQRFSASVPIPSQSYRIPRFYDPSRPSQLDMTIEAPLTIVNTTCSSILLYYTGIQRYEIRTLAQHKQPLERSSDGHTPQQPKRLFHSTVRETVRILLPTLQSSAAACTDITNNDIQFDDAGAAIHHARCFSSSTSRGASAGSGV